MTPPSSSDATTHTCIKPRRGSPLVLSKKPAVNRAIVAGDGNFAGTWGTLGASLTL